METCRACLAVNKDMVPFDDAFVLSYNSLTNLKVSLQDKLPHFLCIGCWKMLESFMGFRAKCIISDSMLKNAICQEIKEDQKESINIKNENDVGSVDVKVEEIEQEIEAEDYLKYESSDNDATFPPLEMLKETATLSPTKNTHFKVTKPKLRIKNKKGNKTKNNSNKCNNDEAVVELPCGICKKTYLEQKELYQHLECHKNDKICELCQENFCDSPEILSHRLKHIPENQRRCHLCTKYYVSHITMEYHYRQKHYNAGIIKLSCNECQRSYDTPIKLRKHIRSVHSKNVLICDYCSKSFNNKSKLISHIYSHTGYKAYFCDKCGYSCKYSSNLRAHKIRTHTKKKVYCKNCNRVFPNQQSHDKHRCSPGNTLCPICGKEIKRSSRMSRHMATHGEGKLYKCDRCPATYKSKTGLQVHLDQHDGIRTKQCEFCPAKFYSATVLLKHRRIHTGERPYVCKICQRSFTGNSNLKVHMKIHGEYLINKKMKPEEDLKI